MMCPLVGDSRPGGVGSESPDMAVEWRDLHWEDLATLEYGKGLRGYESGSGPYRVLGTNGPIGWHTEPLCDHRTVVVGRKGAYRGIHYSDEPCFVIDTAFYLEPRINFDMRWAYYELLTHDINSMDSGSAIPSTSRESFYRLPVRVPPLVEQRAIAHILGTLDDKIELNRRINETLEAMARALFKSWFVDFLPVRAKMERRRRRGESLPGLAAHLWDLFPDRLVGSELGAIPEGWCLSYVGDETHLVKGISYRSDQLADSDTALVTLKSINRGGGYRPDGLKPYTGEYKTEQIISAGELVVAQTDVTQAAEVIGKPALVIPDSRFRVLVASLDLLIVRPSKGDLTQEFFYLLFLTPEFQDHVYGHTNGTTVLHLSKTGVPTYQFVRPPEPLAQIFTKTVRPLFHRVVQNEVESRSLAALRDVLLPRLLSGELRVPFRG